jgi:hypothetical protein
MIENVYLGRPCPKGHSGLRYKSNNGCVQCSKERAQCPKERKRLRASNKRRYAEIRDQRITQQKSYRATLNGRAYQLRRISPASLSIAVACTVAIPVVSPTATHHLAQRQSAEGHPSTGISTAGLALPFEHAYKYLRNDIRYRYGERGNHQPPGRGCPD